MADKEKKKKVRTTGLKVFVRTLLHGDRFTLEEAYRKEAARQVTELVNWREDQEMNDPQGMLWSFEEDYFPMVEQAQKYMNRIYNRNKLVKKCREGLAALEGNPEGLLKEDFLEAKEALQEKWLTIEDEQIALCWRIKKIHMHVTAKARQDAEEAGDEDPFEDYEYDPEFAG